MTFNNNTGYKPKLGYDQKRGYQHKEMPGFGVAYQIPGSEKKSEKSPDFEGFLVLKYDYKAGEKLQISAWEKPTSRGTKLLSLKENTYRKEKAEQENRPVEVSYSYKPKVKAGTDDFDDTEIPF
jgi:hypothetical protein